MGAPGALGALGLVGALGVQASPAGFAVGPPDLYPPPRPPLNHLPTPPTPAADTFHKPGFKLQARILHHLFAIVQVRRGHEAGARRRADHVYA